MIDAKSLRIGNYYEVDGAIFKVSKIDKGGFQGELIKKANGMHTNGGRQQPIELTPELLIKCGFEKSKFNSGWQWTKIIRSGFEIIAFGFDQSADNELFFWTQIKVVPLKHLHELQNLYWLIMNKELEINL